MSCMNNRLEVSGECEWQSVGAKRRAYWHTFLMPTLTKKFDTM
jgi:hypothetical protein